MLINLGRHRLMDCIMSLPRFYQVSMEEKSSQHCQHPLSCYQMGLRLTCLRFQG